MFCHVTCLPCVTKDDCLYTERETNQWLCIVCSKSVFPVNHYDDEIDFLNEKNISSFQSKFQQTDFSSVLHMNDAQQAFTQFHQTYIGLYDSCFPVKTVKVGYRNKKDRGYH